MAQAIAWAHVGSDLCHHEALLGHNELIQWGPVIHICISKLTILGSDNGLSPGWHQAIIWSNTGILLIGPLGTNFSEILIEIYTFSRKKEAILSWPQCVNHDDMEIDDEMDDEMETFSALLALSVGFRRHRWIPRTQGQWLGALMFSLIYTWINGWANNGEAADLRRHRAHYDVTVMRFK